MKRPCFNLLLAASLLITILIAPQARPGLAAPNPPPDRQVWSQAEAAIQRAIRQSIAARAENQPVLMLTDTRIDQIQISADGNWATARLTPVDRQTRQVLPTEPGLAVLQRRAGEWSVALPGDSSWSGLASASPGDLLSPAAKSSWLQLALQTQEQAVLGPFGGYRLPWAAGQTMYLTQSVAHDQYTPSLTAHYAFDFAKPGYPSGMWDIYAAKAGAVKLFDDHWPTGHQNPENWNETNYLLIEDTTTSPATYMLYLHLANNSIPPVLKTVGAPVAQGQFIGIADNTGLSSGNHLHFMVHTNPYSYWGRSVDITFDDVDINGGRPRYSGDLPWCLNEGDYHDICEAYRNGYVSGNTPHGDVTAPRGDISNPPSNGMNFTTAQVQLEGWAVDDDSGLYSAQFIANYDGTWRAIGPSFSTSPFSYNWNLCSAPVPDGPLSVALRLRDNQGNLSNGMPGLRHFTKDYACQPPPPACTPNANQVALFADPDFQGACLTLGTGSYPSAASLGSLGEDNAASIQVGANLIATLYMDEDFSGRGESFSANDSSLGDNWIGSDSLSSLLVQPKSSTPGAPRPLSPPARVDFPAHSSLSLAWESGGAASQYQARLSDLSQTITRPWSAEPVWRLGSLDSGSYTWQVRAQNSSATSAWSSPLTFTVQTAGSLPPVSPAPFSDTMESGYNNWTNSRYWDQTNVQNHTTGGSISWMYDTNSTGYDTGSPNSGDLTSPPIQIPGAGYYLRFWYRYETESPGLRWDQRWVQISADGAPFQPLLQLSDDPPNWWLRSPAIDLSPYAGKAVQVRFHFETLDAARNNYQGWFIDDLSITSQPPPDCPPDESSPAQPAAISYNSSQSGLVCQEGDMDYFRFSAQAGDQIGAYTVAQNTGSTLDTILSLLDSDGSSLLVENDDQEYGVRTDSALSYTIRRSGDYLLKLRAWNHPSAGGTQASYTLHLLKDSARPGAALTSPPAATFLPKTPFSVTATAVEAPGGEISHVEFLWHSGDWQYGEWTPIGVDWDGSDGWSAEFDPTTIPDQKDMAIYVRAHDWAGNWGAAAIWDLALDTTPPQSALQALPLNQKNTAILLQWSGQDNLAGLDHFDLQRKQDSNAWQDWLLDLDPDLNQVWLVAQKGHTYSFRLRAADRVGNLEAYPAAAEAVTTIPQDVCAASGDTYEPDNDPAAIAAYIPYSKTLQTHTFCNPEPASTGQDDQDWIRFNLDAGERLVVFTSPSGGAAVELDLYQSPDPASQLLASHTPQAFNQPSQITWQAPTAGAVYLRMRHIDGRVIGDEVAYEVHLGQGLPIFLPLLQSAPSSASP